ncbi:MAG: hypothetical protein L6R35_005222 [Caloplaca aegaea]|nr:MAG: hypothetical protein L6R35_005222 [Caloplaca aegaea]
MNVSATLNFLRLIRRPSLCLPHVTLSNFNDLPIPLSEAFGPLKPDIRAVVIDKDNCFAVPKENVIYKPYQILRNPLQEKFHSLLTTYPSPHLLIVSNSAGTNTSDPTSTHARLLSANTGVPVFRHSTKKPGCGPQVLAHFLNAPGSRVTAASQIAVVGDRLFTDVMTANLMGSWAVWVRDGVVESRNPVSVDGWMGARGDGVQGLNADV